MILFYVKDKFQFLSGSIKRAGETLTLSSGATFQFLSGSIKSILELAGKQFTAMFQFLSGSIKRQVKRAV